MILLLSQILKILEKINPIIQSNYEYVFYEQEIFKFT